MRTVRPLHPLSGVRCVAIHVRMRWSRNYPSDYRKHNCEASYHLSEVEFPVEATVRHVRAGVECKIVVADHVYDGTHYN